MDVHGAGAQRSDMKSGNPASVPQGRGPQGDVMRIHNMVRCVRGGAAEPRTTGPKIKKTRTQRSLPRSSMMNFPGAQQGMRPPMQGRGGQGPSGADFVRRLDRDGDGKVSRQEFDGPAQHFSQFDRNQDGYLSQDEAPQGPPPQRNRGMGGRRR